MGIQGLLPLLKSIEKPVHLKDYAGQTLAIDGYVWLHKGAFACAQELCLGQPTQKYVAYFMRKIEMFKFFDVKPYVVFDGGYLPSKAATEQDRLSRREESKKLAMDLLHAGKSKLALEQFRKCVDVTPEMAFAVIQALEAANVDFVVAPYEADAQMAYLEKKGLVDGIITEDSDLLVFGCRRVIFKLDQYGAGIEILHENFNMVREVSFHEWSITEIRHMCILAGCDYLPSIPGMGLKTSQRLLRRFKTVERVIKHLRMENASAKIHADYENAFRRADLTFLYARVYDPVTKSMEHLNLIPEELEELVQTEEYDFLGPILEKSVVQGIAAGKVNPINKATLTCPSTQHPTQKYASKQSANMDKENRSYVDNSSRLKMPSTKSIQAYFVKTSTSATTTAMATQKDVFPRRESLKGSGAVVEMSALEKSLVSESAQVAENLSLTIVPRVLQEQSLTTENTSETVVVEARSRFFGVKTHVSSEVEACPNPQSRLIAVREDSGIGLDEELLLHTPDIYCSLSEDDHLSKETTKTKSLPSKPLSNFKMPRTDGVSMRSADNTESLLEDNEDLAKAEAKVIQGWREKFSNPSGSMAVRTPGLKRAFQGSSGTAKSAYVSSSQPARQITTNPTKMLRPSVAQSAGLILTTPGHPIHHLDTVRRTGSTVNRSSSRATIDKPSLSSPSRTLNETLAQGGSDALSRATENKGAPNSTLNLDRFKYTRVSTPLATTTTTTAELGP